MVTLKYVTRGVIYGLRNRALAYLLVIFGFLIGELTYLSVIEDTFKIVGRLILWGGPTQPPGRTCTSYGSVTTDQTRGPTASCPSV